MSSEDSHSIKRRRVARACDTCRRKKVRCDGVQPGSDPPSCTNCKAYGYECAFIDAPKKRGPPKGYIEALETRLQRMESILGGLVQSGDLPEGTISSNLEWINVDESNFRSAQESNNSSGTTRNSVLRKNSSFSSTSTISNNLRKNSSKSLMSSSNNHHNNNNKNNNNNNGQNSDSEECFSSDGNEYTGSQYDLNDSMGQIAMDESGHTKYLGNSSGIFLLKITKKVANGQIITIPADDLLAPVKRIGSNVVLELPPKELCDKLLDAYWKQVHPYMPFIDKQDLMEKYNNLEANYPSIILLYAIFAVSAKFVDDPTLNSEIPPGSYYFTKAKELLKDEYDKATISTVQALLLLSIHVHGHKDSVTWVYIGLAIRLAQDMGLHRDSSKWNFDERQGELRRRVWWACVTIDRFASAGLGRPLAINESDCDVDYPISGKIPEDDSDCIESWVEVIKCNLILGRILNHIYGIKSKSSQGNVESVLATLDNELNEWRDNLPKKFHFDSTTMNVLDVTSNRKMVIHLLYYTLQILLHRPHIRGPKSKAPPSSIPSLTICTMAANNITHVLYRGMKDGDLRFGSYTIYSFFTASSMHIINALSGDDRFREVAKHGLRMSLKCLEYMSDYWYATDKLSHLIRDLLKSRNIELDGYSEASSSSSKPLKTTTTSSSSSSSSSTTTKSKKRSRYVKLEDMASEGTPRDKNPFLNCLPEPIEGRPRPKITFAPSPTKNLIEQNQQQQQQRQQQQHQANIAYAAYWNSSQQQQQQTPQQFNSTSVTPVLSSSSEINSPTMKSPANDAMQYEQTSSPESTTSSSPGFQHFTEFLTADSGLFPQNADAFSQDSSLLFDIDDQMNNNNPFLSLPSTIDWNDLTDWTEYMLRMQNLKNSNHNVDNMTSSANLLANNGIPTNSAVSNPNMQSATALMNPTTIPSMTNMTY